MAVSAHDDSPTSAAGDRAATVKSKKKSSFLRSAIEFVIVGCGCTGFGRRDSHFYCSTLLRSQRLNGANPSN